MAQETRTTNLLDQIAIDGDLDKLTPQERAEYYQAVCESLGLNPLTRPLEYIVLNRRLTLYAKRDATDQLRKIHGVSITALSRETIEGVYVVMAQARDATGREDSDMGAVATANLKGDNLANAMLKAVTKAKRRVTLSICGLGMLDETEVETIPGAQVVPVEKAHDTLTKEVKKEVKDEPIGQERAVMMMKEFEKEGVKQADALAVCSAALGREVTSLSELTDAEARRCWRYAKQVTAPVN